jgi:hypothetical protein
MVHLIRRRPEVAPVSRLNAAMDAETVYFTFKYDISVGDRALIAETLADKHFGYSLAAFRIECVDIDDSEFNAAIRVDGRLARLSLTPQEHIVVLLAYPKQASNWANVQDSLFTDTTDAIDWIAQNTKGLWSMMPAILPDRLAPAFSFTDEREALTFQMTFG